jgi:proline iminopeptidase
VAADAAKSSLEIGKLRIKEEVYVFLTRTNGFLPNLLLGSVLAVPAPVGFGQPQAPLTREGQLTRGDFTLHYKIIGTGTPLLLLSGGPGLDVGYMTPIAQELGSSYECLLLEQRGTGQSQPPVATAENMTVKLAVEDVEALRVSLKLERITILGHSWGGMLAMAYAAVHPDHVKSLILVDSGGMDSSFARAFQDNITARESVSDRQKIAEVDAATPGMPVLRLLTPFYFFDRALGEKIAVNAPNDIFNPKTAELMGDDTAKHYNVRKHMTAFRRPVLIIQGRQDPMPESTAIETNHALRDSSLVFLDECGHFPWIEQPKEFFSRVRAFLEGNQ